MVGDNGLVLVVFKWKPIVIEHLMNRNTSSTYNAHQDDDSLPYVWEGIFDIRTDPSIANRVYVIVLATGNTDKGGLYRSDDAGNSWKKITLPSLDGVNPDRPTSF